MQVNAISFYSRPGIDERNVNYEKKYGWTDEDIEYNHYYSNKDRHCLME